MKPLTTAPLWSELEKSKRRAVGQVPMVAAPPTRLLFIAYGNPWRHDDGAGLALATQVLPYLHHQGYQVELVAVQQLTPDLALDLADPTVAAAYFFDATVTPEPAGIQIHPLVATTATAVVGHHLSPAVLLLYAARLYAHCPPAWLVTVPGSDFALGEGLSPTTARYLAQAEPLAWEIGLLAASRAS
ncbi:MAG: hypothetical protein KF832_18200 [Caldilineaceae bacterium]|nr:hypothetical protein [Caldilineaceae bacterium]